MGCFGCSKTISPKHSTYRITVDSSQNSQAKFTGCSQAKSLSSSAGTCKYPKIDGKQHNKAEAQSGPKRSLSARLQQMFRDSIDPWKPLVIEDKFFPGGKRRVPVLKPLYENPLFLKRLTGMRYSTGSDCSTDAPDESDRSDHSWAASM